ncbi:hypothetical protein EC968_000002 [Mortierella alpina]|nr:hypothetical protein EC968_000002 [Mortierella alpina]
MSPVQSQRKRRICVGSTHIIRNNSKGFKKPGQIVALVSAAKEQMRRNPDMPLGAVDLAQIPTSQFSRPLPNTAATLVEEGPPASSNVQG